MIPSDVLKILSGTMVSHLGTRDARLQGCEVFVWGVKIDADKKQFTAFIPKEIAARTISNVENNGRVSALLGEPHSHELYQFKGTFVSCSDATNEDEIIQDNYVNTFYENYLKVFGYPKELMSTFNYKPAVGICFDIEEIYIQTPGPKAGTMIYTKQPIAL